MIIECGYCGAPLDVTKGVTSVRCSYCESANQVRQQKTVAEETPQGWRPPPRWVPPEHARADSAETLSHHAVQAVRGVGRLLMGLVSGVFFLAVAGGGVSMFLASQAAQRATQNAVPPGVAAQLAGAVQDAQKAVQKAQAIPFVASQTNLLTSAGVKEALQAYKAALGVQRLSLHQLVLHASHSTANAQSPQDPSHVNAYNYRGGQATQARPVRLSSRDKKTLKSALFDPEKTALSKLNELKTVALGKLAYEETKISHVIVDRRRGKTQLRIYGSSPRESGYVLFSESGKVVRVYR